MYYPTPPHLADPVVTVIESKNDDDAKADNDDKDNVLYVPGVGANELEIIIDIEHDKK